MSGTPGLTRLLDERQVAELLGVSTRTVQRLRLEGLPYLRIRRQVRFDEAQVRVWQDRQRETGPVTVQARRRGRPRRPVQA